MAFNLFEIWTILTLILSVYVLSEDVVKFPVELETIYLYESNNTLGNDVEIKISAKLSISPINNTEDSQKCRLVVSSFHQTFSSKNKVYGNSRYNQLDFTKWFFFQISKNGEVIKVFYPKNEVLEVIALKKSMISSLSARLHTSEEAKLSGMKWSYKINETGHVGMYESIYNAEVNKGNIIKFEKNIVSPHIVPNAQTKNKKKIIYDSKSKLIHSVVAQEYFIAPQEPPQGYKTENSIYGSKRNHQKLQKDDFDIPLMKSTANWTLTFLQTNSIPKDFYPDILLSDIVEDTLEIKQIPKPASYVLTDIENYIYGNITCVASKRNLIVEEKIVCFHELIHLLENLRPNDLTWVAREYLLGTTYQESYKEVVVDALGAMASDTSQSLLAELVLHAEPPNANLIMRSMVHVVGLEKSPAALFLDALENIAIDKYMKFSDQEDTKDVHTRAILVLAAIIPALETEDNVRAKDILKKIEENLGIHDPYHHRQLRSLLPLEDIQLIEEEKAVLIHALGNAVADSSFPYIMSYANVSGSSLLQRSGIAALAKYHNEEAVSTLLDITFTSENENIRYTAALECMSHPMIKEMGLFEENLYFINEYENTSYVPYLKNIKKRSIFDGVEFNLKTPDVDWQKYVGSSDIGASFGVILKNVLDVQVKPLSGDLQIDIDDSAWTTAHLGILGIDYHLLYAKVCFKGHIGYEVNILQEFNFDEVKKLADLYNIVVGDVVKSIKDTFSKFKSIMNYGVNGIVDEVVNIFKRAIEEFPQIVKNIKKSVLKTVKNIGQYNDLPEPVTRISDAVDRAMTLFTDIKRDVMDFYRSVTGAIKVTLPWAIEQIKQALELALNSLKALLQSPLKAIGDISKSIIKVKSAVTGILQAKENIEEKSFFLEGNQPYWFNLEDQLERLRDDLQAAFSSLDDLWDWVQEGFADNDPVEHFTGISSSVVRQQIFDDINREIEGILEPILELKSVADPFIDAFYSLTNTIKEIKEAYIFIKNGYEKAKSIVTKIFGPRVHTDFPRKLAQTDCGDGFWESTVGGSLPGIDLEIEVGKMIVAPFNGFVTKEDGNVISLKVVDDVEDTEIFLYNVELLPDKNNLLVSKGEEIATVISSGCTPNSIHFSMRSTKIGQNAIDPTSFLRKRNLPPPKWIQECNDYSLVFLNKIISQGTITKGPKLENTSQEIVSTEVSTDVVYEPENHSISRRKRSLFSDIIESAKEAIFDLEFPTSSDVERLLSFDFMNVSLENILDLVKKVGLKNELEKIEKLIKLLQNILSDSGKCVKLETLDGGQLDLKLQMSGKPTGGIKKDQITRLKEPPEGCSFLSFSINKNSYCSFSSNCLSITCCVELELFNLHRMIEIYAGFNPCNGELIMNIGKWSKTFEIYSEETFPFEMIGSITDGMTFEIFEVFYVFQIDKTDEHLKITLELTLCSSKSEGCLPSVTIFDRAVFTTNNCDEIGRQRRQSNSQIFPSSNALLGMSLNEVLKMSEVLELDTDISELFDDLQELYADVVIRSIDMVLSNKFSNEFESFDLKLGSDKKMGPYNVKFFEATFYFFLGPFRLYFGFGSGGGFSFNYDMNLAIVSMEAGVSVTPQVGANVWGALGVSLGPFRAEVRLTGYLLTTAFPTRIELQFNVFPIDVGTCLDLNLVPLRLELRVLLLFKIKIPFVGTIKKTLISKRLWQYTTPNIHKNIFTIGEIEPDDTPPQFIDYYKGPTDLLDCFQDEDCENNKKRSSSYLECIVRQVPGRDYTEPAFELNIGVEDDLSLVEMTFSVGTYRGGSDVIKNQPLSGASSLIALSMDSGIPLYFTITATNSAKKKSVITCELPTYDVTPPGGRVTPDFLYTSHPNYIISSGLALDDSKIVSEMESVGYGPNIYGDQVVAWHTVESNENTESVDVGHDPLGTQSLEHFSKPRQGRVFSKPHFTASNYAYPQQCALKCLELPETKCLSFNYDYGDSGKCELLEEIEGHGVKIYQDGYFHNFERIGIGHTIKFLHDNLELQHNQIYFNNLFISNTLGYTSVLSSEGILCDFTPPEPGLILNEVYDRVSNEQCVNFVSEEWIGRCIQETPLPNHRAIIDGPESLTVFNGHEPLVDLCCTRANKYVSANWDGFHDDESGIYGYLVGVGTEPCLDDVHPHHDPHSHIFHKSEWTHTMIAGGLNLNDGLYHVSVRALNKVEFGGPMATTVCHSKPYVIDNTRPAVHLMTLQGYDEETCIISILFNVSDDLSGMREVDFGLGLSKRDTYLLGWQRYPNLTSISHQMCIPDGVRAWVKIRAINNVDLRTIGIAPNQIIVDTSAPIEGMVFDGSEHGKDINYTSDGSLICSNWKDFSDEQSGISEYWWGVGNEPFNDDLLPFISLTSVTLTTCESLMLIHNTLYFSTLIAFNGGLNIKNVSASSDGVLYDATPPEEGWLIDGHDRSTDMVYSSEPSTVSAVWGNYLDPESDIKEYLVEVYRKEIQNETQELPIVIHEAESVDSSTEYINWHHFHLQQGDFVFVKLSALNRAKRVTSTVSSGFTVDLTSPFLLFLGDGADFGRNNIFSSSLTSLSANWDFEDLESGIDHYELSIWEKHGGTRQQIYPSDSWEIIRSSVNVWNTTEIMSLKEGALYTVRVSAINGAGLSSVYDTDGVIIDSSSPIILKLYVGVIGGSSEELFDGFVVQSDQTGIQATWLALDHESGISAYWVAVGSSPGEANIKAYHNMGSLTNAYINNLNLEFYDATSPQPVIFYVAVKAENGAGLFSQEIISSPIKILPGDKAGLVYDGVLHENEVDYQSDTATVTFNFQGFESQTSGIDHYEWAVGTSLGNDDVQPFSSLGIIPSNDIEEELGLTGSGKAQGALNLEAEMEYFVLTRATTGAGNILEASSNGFVVDVTPPRVTIESIGNEENNLTLLNTESVYYQKSIDWLTAKWRVSEPESRVTSTIFSVGSYPGGSDVFGNTNSSGLTAIPNALVRPLKFGKPNIVSVSSHNEVPLFSKETSSSLIVDNTPPLEGLVNCPQYVSDGYFTCSWNGFYDEESTIAFFKIGLGVQEGDTSIVDLIELSAEDNFYTFKDFMTGKNLHTTKYYVTIAAYNHVGLYSIAYSAAINLDNTPPNKGKVIELSGIEDLELVQSGNESLLQSSCGSLEELSSCLWPDSICQASLSRVIAFWQHFQDFESPIVNYEVALGSTRGGSQLKNFMQIPESQNYAILDDLDLSAVRQVFVTVKGTNAAGLTATSISNGVYISRITAGLEPLGQNYVWDGDQDYDLDYQDNIEALYAQWNFQGDPCPVATFKWEIINSNGEILQPMVAVPNGKSDAVFDGINMRNGDSYYIVVTATNELGYSYSRHSDGITIQIEPLIPGNVRDGNIFGYDLMYQPSITSISGNWDGFGANSIEYEPEQRVAYYEAAVGSDRRYPSGRTNVRPYVNVGKNHTYTFDNLLLTPQSVTYYITVRAHSESTYIAEVTSNGIRVGYNGEIISTGNIKVPRFISSDKRVVATWNGFRFALPVIFYQFGIGSANYIDFLLQHFDCRQLQNVGEEFSSQSMLDLFDIYPLSNVGKDTMKEASNLNLTQGDAYKVVVIATSQSSQCAMSEALFTVDTTPPNEGSIHIGEFTDASVTYTDSKEELRLTWEDFNDIDSGLDLFEISLYQASSCWSQNTSFTTIVDSIQLPVNESAYTFLDLNLLDRIPYFVKLCGRNGAGLSACKWSPPVFVDIENPIGGEVRDGISPQKDREYQGFTDRMEGLILLLPDSQIEKCPFRLFKLNTKDNENWLPINQDGIVGLDKEHRIFFQSNKISFDSTEGLSIEIIRDVQKQRVLSGAFYYNNPDISAGGSIQIEIKAAGGGLNAVTSFTLWDGPQGTIGDFEPGLPLQPTELDECKCCLYATQSPITDVLENITMEATDSSIITEVTFQNVNSTSNSSVAPVNPATTTILPNPYGCNCDCKSYLKNISNLDDTTENVQPVTTMDETPWEVKKGIEKNYVIASEHSMQPAIGFQLYSDMVVGNEKKSFAVLWVKFANESIETLYDIVEIDFDPSEAFHNYEILVKKDDTYENMESMVKFVADGRTLAVIYGAPALTSSANLILSVWNYDDYVPDIKDIFYPPSSMANFRNLKLPPSDETPCRYMSPFRNGDSAIATFLVGVGSTPESDDIAPLRPLVYPCIPCTGYCDNGICDEDCKSNEVYEYLINITGLQLSPSSFDTSLSQMRTSPYYLTVEAMTGSGRKVKVSSSGIIIDTTPPVFENLYHVNLQWSLDEPTDYLGYNTTIAVKWEAYDLESPIKEYLWAIGSNPGRTDIQDYKSVGLKEMAMNPNLLNKLQDQNTYYVSVKAINAAGLEQIITTSGVTILLSPPNTSGANTSLACDDPTTSNVDLPDTNLCGDQEALGLSWNKVDDNFIESYNLIIGSGENKDDVFPETIVGYNASGEIDIKYGKFFINGEEIFDLSELDTTGQQQNGFRLEPGRELFIKVMACNYAHLCNDLKVERRIIRRENDIIQISKNGSIVSVILQKYERTIRSVDTSTSKNFIINITTLSGVKGNGIIAGILSQDDMQNKYVSGANPDYQPYIVNPIETSDLTDRNLKNRNKEWINLNVYIKEFVAVKNGPLQFEPLFVMIKSEMLCLNVSLIGSIPKILFWDQVHLVWANAAQTCTGDDYLEIYDPENCTLQIKICSFLETSINSRKRRAVDSDIIDTVALSMAFVEENFYNTAPIITSTLVLWMDEDSGTLKYQLEAYDDENDNLGFYLNNSWPLPMGEVSLSSNGYLQYKPCRDCFGSIHIYFYVIEERNDEHPLLYANEILTISIQKVNDFPEIFYIMGSTSAVKRQDKSYNVAIEQNAMNPGNNVSSFTAVIASFDVDIEDISFSISHPSNGSLIILDETSDIIFEFSSCESDEFNGQSISNQLPSKLSLPFGSILPHSFENLSKLATTLHYTPDEDFYGLDVLKILVKDNNGFYSEALTIHLYVLAFPCQNGATCLGPIDDPSCISLERASGFMGYSCSCLTGYEGHHCEIDINECSSSPCPSNFTCVDEVNTYICVCENSDCATISVEVFFAPWKIALIAIMLCLASVIVGIFLFKSYTNKTKMTSTKVMTLNGNREQTCSMVSSKDKDENKSETSEQSTDLRPQHATSFFNKFFGLFNSNKISPYPVEENKKLHNKENIEMREQNINLSESQIKTSKMIKEAWGVQISNPQNTSEKDPVKLGIEEL